MVADAELLDRSGSIWSLAETDAVLVNVPTALAVTTTLMVAVFPSPSGPTVHVPATGS